ncbi:MAG TPA: SDR family oxidoreductase [Acidimicrobiales bacterium]|jgi:NAD(P)-dependent dehydrogenase (short-subunit alcohol dehydrogenase family)|nr:SDR family oxidoreductase [Acidimicrobiales bacterium]
MSEKKGVLVTGASSGIGAAIAVELARQGYVVGCASRRGIVPEGDGSLMPIALDVTDAEAAADVLQLVADSGGGLVGVVHAAGRYSDASAALIDMAEVRSVFETNLFSAIRISQLAYPHLRGGGGFIAFIGSMYAQLGVKGAVAYSATKAAIASVCRTLAVEWAPDGISILNFAPGWVETGFNDEYLADDAHRARLTRGIPVGRVGRPDELGRLVAAVVSADCSFLTGETIDINGGHRIRL